ncbi:MAG: siderophore-interacting protein [Sandaracinaceae bacterium]
MGRATGAMAKIFGKRARVRGVAAPTPGLRRVHLEGDDLVGLRIQPGDKVKVDVGGGVMRSYTPSAVDVGRGQLEMLIHVHGDAPGSRWTVGLRPGDPVRFIGPTRSLDGTVAPATPWLAFYGDETAVGLAEFIVAQQPGAHVWGALSLARPELPIADRLPLDGVLRGEEHGPALVRHLEAMGRPPGDGVVFLSGEAGAVLQLRAALLAMGIARAQMRIKPYWSVRGKAHRKQLEKTALRR